jgi:cell division control protein 45
LEKAGKNVIQPMMETNGGSGGVVVCLGVGGLVDLGALLGFEADGDEASYGGVEVWVVDARRPWNLGNVFGGFPVEIQEAEGGEVIHQPPKGVVGGMIQKNYKPGKGGIIVFDDGDIEEDMKAEKDAYLTLVDMPEVEDDGDDSEGSETGDDSEAEEPSQARKPGKKRKSWSDRDEEDDSDEDNDRPRQRRRSNSVCVLQRHIKRVLILYSSQVQYPSLQLVHHNEDSYPLQILLYFRATHDQYLHHQHNLRNSHPRERCGDGF